MIYADDEHNKLMTEISDAHQVGVPVPCMTSTRPLDWISDAPTDQRRAATGCAICPLAPKCRDYATTFKEPAGVWGGSLPTDRIQKQAPRLKKVVKTDAAK